MYKYSKTILLITAIVLVMLSSSHEVEASVSLDAMIRKNLDYLLDDYWNAEHPEFLYQTSKLTAGRSSFYNIQELRDLAYKQHESFVNYKDTDLYIPIVPAKYRWLSENVFRPLTHLCFVFASAHKYGLYPERDDEICEKAVKLIGAISGCKSFEQHSWQSPLWKEQVGCAAWFMWDKLDNKTRQNIKRIVIYEAEEITSKIPQYYKDCNGNIKYPGDTKAEENSWQARVLALAVCMYPDNENAGKWEQKMNEYLVASTTTPKDASKGTAEGSNIDDNGFLVNHGIVHPDYMVYTMEAMEECAVLYKITDKEIPLNATFNHSLMYSALCSVDLGAYDDKAQGHTVYAKTKKGKPKGNIDIPWGSDWGGNWYPLYYLADVEADVFGFGGKISRKYGSKHLSMISKMLDKNNGAFFNPGEDEFVSGETFMSMCLIKSYILKEMFL